jgi:c-di-GMP-binding flagellar brake protein YcgR
MSELLEKDQVISIVPQDFRNSNKGKVLDILDKKFLLEVFHDTKGILINNVMEFYSPTKNGMLFFASSVLKIDGNILTVLIPKKHRFLQRRAFTRINFRKDIDCKLDGKAYKVKSLDLSAGGIKFETKEHLDIDSEYDLGIRLLSEQSVKCKLQSIRVEKNDEGTYTLSGRFKNLSNIDRMTLIQFCMRRNIEKMNK